jgi:cytochrome b
MKNRILIWDLATRVFHWSLALAFAGAFATAESDRFRDLHVALGYTVLGLVVFRAIWGFAGSRYARFDSFVFGWSSVKRYLSSLVAGRPEHHLGHNPAGSWAIFGLLALGVLVPVSGILLYQGVGGEEAFEEPHEFFGHLMLLLVLVHVAGVLVSSLLHRENLVRSMLDGRKEGPAEAGIPGSRTWLAAIIAAVVGMLAVYGQAAVDSQPSATALHAAPHDEED